MNSRRHTRDTHSSVLNTQPLFYQASGTRSLPKNCYCQEISWLQEQRHHLRSCGAGESHFSCSQKMNFKHQCLQFCGSHLADLTKTLQMSLVCRGAEVQTDQDATVILGYTNTRICARPASEQPHRQRSQLTRLTLKPAPAK